MNKLHHGKGSKEGKRVAGRFPLRNYYAREQGEVGGDPAEMSE